MKKTDLFLALLILLAAFNSQARSPSVEPISEINTEHYNHVAPEKAKGFNFSNSKAIQNEKTSSFQPDSKVERTIAQQRESTKKSSFSFLWFSLLLPVAVWYGAMRSFKDNKKIQEDFANKIFEMKNESNKNINSKDHDTDIAA